MSVGTGGVGASPRPVSTFTPTPLESTFTPISSADAAPAAVSEAPAAITAPAAMRAIRIRVFFVIWLLPPVAHRQ
ncbi:hypothetical protein SALBM311S_02484 [Streptomyces alboniger]